MPRGLVGDPLRLRQVLLNLGDNAVKFTEKGEICVARKVDEVRKGWVHFEVRDTGIGI